MLFASTAAAVVLTSPGWSKGPETVVDAGWPSLRSLSTIAPVLVLAQIALGAAFRHKALGVLPHIAGAIVVTLAILMTGMFVSQQCPDHRPLKSAAATMMTVVFCQVFLGIAALTERMINSIDTPVVVLVTGAHVVTGALALGATVALSLQIRRHVVPRPKRVEA
jgi:heme A synthase